MLDITKDIQSLTTFRRHKPHLYRVIYGVLEKRKHVEVLHIRHGARRKRKSSDLA